MDGGNGGEKPGPDDQVDGVEILRWLTGRQMRKDLKAGVTRTPEEALKAALDRAQGLLNEGKTVNEVADVLSSDDAPNLN